MFKGLIKRASNIVKMDNLEDKIIASNHIRVEQNLLLNRMQKALV